MTTEATQQSFDVHSPWDGTVIASCPDEQVGAVDGTIRTAADAAKGWAATPAPARALVLAEVAHRLRAEAVMIGRTLSHEAGKPEVEARGEVARAADVINYAAGLAQQPDGFTIASTRPGVQLSTGRRPLGVVAAITPFNFPAFVPSLKLGPALAAGNAVVWKPAPQTPLTALAIAEVAAQAGLPDGVLSTITGGNPQLGVRLTEHPEIAAVSFTGSTTVGRQIVNTCTARGVRVQAEMGGFNPLVVLNDCDPAFAIETALEGAFGYAGQKCTATRISLVESDLYDEFLSGLLERVAQSESESPLNPLISESARDHIHDQVCRLRTRGAEILIGGERISGASDCYYPRTVAALGAERSVVLDDEIFGPVLQVYRVGGLDQAMDIIKSSSHGLSASILTSHMASAHGFLGSVSAGQVGVNVATTGVEPQVPFGGCGDSGWGPREVGPRALDFYSLERSFTVRHQM